MADNTDLQASTLQISVGLHDTDKGVQIGVDGDAFWRVHITPQGTILLGDGTEPPSPLAGSSGDIATDALWAAVGDLVVGDGNNSAVILPKGAEGEFLRVGAATVAWALLTEGDIPVELARVADVNDALDILSDALVAHVDDAAGAHAAEAISVTDTADYFTAAQVEGILAELGLSRSQLRALMDGIGTTINTATPGEAKVDITATDVQVFTATEVDGWEKPANATIVDVLAIGGGGGGAPGRKGAAGGDRFGGGGGQGGQLSRDTLLASACGATETITVGAGGNGGTAATTDSTNGGAPTGGGTSSFGSLVTASGGSAGGNHLIGGVGGGVVGNQAMKRGSYRVSEGGTSLTTGTPVTPPGGHVGGGGAGGAISAANTARAGGNSSGSVGAGGSTGGAVGANGVAGAAGTGTTGGAGGSGGGASNGTTVGAGGAGGNYGGGGGGGGAGIDGVTDSGAGGNGAPGIVVVISSR